MQAYQFSLTNLPNTGTPVESLRLQISKSMSNQWKKRQKASKPCQIFLFLQKLVFQLWNKSRRRQTAERVQMVLDVTFHREELRRYFRNLEDFYRSITEENKDKLRKTPSRGYIRKTKRFLSC